MGDQNLYGSETTNNAIMMMEIVGVDAGSDTGEKSKPKNIGLDASRLKRARGRPRKYEVGGNKQSPMSVSTSPEFAIQPFGSEVKRGRGRPRGSGKLQILASIGGCVAETAGGSITPHVLIVNPKEDVVGKIFTFFQKVHRTVCILSAAGSVSTVILRQPSVSDGSSKYEGNFQILSLNGSYTFTSGAGGGAVRKIGMLSVSLAKPDGTVFGGGIESSLIAATPIQLILATFKQNISNQIKRKYSSPNMAATNGVTEGDNNMKGETTTNGVSQSENFNNLKSESVGDGVIDHDSETLKPVNANSVP